MSYVDTLYRCPEELIKLFRSLEQIRKKEINSKWSIVFNETCIKENLWPNFTNKNKRERRPEGLQKLQWNHPHKF